MKTITITVGWTRSDGERDERGRIVRLTYSSFDGWKPGASQHVETITLDMPEGTEDLDVCDLMYRATNDPYAESASTRPALAPIAAALHANGYRGQGAHWSLSVGDTVTIEGKRYACESSGWRLAELMADLTDEELIALTRDPDPVTARLAELAYAERDTSDNVRMFRKEASEE